MKNSIDAVKKEPEPREVCSNSILSKIAAKNSPMLSDPFNLQKSVNSTSNQKLQSSKVEIKDFISDLIKRKIQIEKTAENLTIGVTPASVLDDMHADIELLGTKVDELLNLM